MEVYVYMEKALGGGDGTTCVMRDPAGAAAEDAKRAHCFSGGDRGFVRYITDPSKQEEDADGRRRRGELFGAYGETVPRGRLDRDLKKARAGRSPAWQITIGFSGRDAPLRTRGQMRDMVSAVMPRFIEGAGMDMGNVRVVCGTHLRDARFPHVHALVWEDEPRHVKLRDEVTYSPAHALADRVGCLRGLVEGYVSGKGGRPGETLADAAAAISRARRDPAPLASDACTEDVLSSVAEARRGKDAWERRLTDAECERVMATLRRRDARLRGAEGRLYVSLSEGLSEAEAAGDSLERDALTERRRAYEEGREEVLRDIVRRTAASKTGPVLHVGGDGVPFETPETPKERYTRNRRARRRRRELLASLDGICSAMADSALDAAESVRAERAEAAERREGWAREEASLARAGTRGPAASAREKDTGGKDR